MDRKDALIQALNQNIYGGKGPQINSSSSANRAEELQKALNDAIGIMPGKKTADSSFQRQTKVETSQSAPKAPSATPVSAAAAYSDFQTRNLFDDDVNKWMGAYQATHDANFGKKSKEDKTAAIYNNITRIEDTYTPRAVQTERAGLQPTVGLPGVGQVPRYEMPSVDYATVRNLWDATQDQLAYVLYSGEFTEAEAQAIADRLYSVKHQYDQIQANKSSGKTVSSGGFSGGIYLGDSKEKGQQSADINWRYGETAEEFMQEFRYQNANDGNRYNRRWAYATREQLPYMTIDQVIDTAFRREDTMGIVALGYLAGMPVTKEQYDKIMAAAETAYKQGLITQTQAEGLKLERKSAGTAGNPQLVNQALSYYGNNGTLETIGEGIDVGSQIGIEQIFVTPMESANQILARANGYVNEAIGGVLDMMGFDVGKQFVARGEEQQRYINPKLRASQQYLYSMQRDYGEKVQGIDNRVGRWFANAVPGLVSSLVGMAASSMAGGYITSGAVPIPVVEGTGRALNATKMAAGYRAMNYGLKNAGLFVMAGNAALNTYGQKFADEQLDEGQRIRYALADGAAEFFTEKLFGGNPLLDGEETGLFTKLVYKLTGSSGYDSVAKSWLECIKSGSLGALAQKLVSSEAFDMAGEGLEEVLSSVGMMAMDYATYGQSDTTWESLGNDFATGLLLSLIMTGGQKLVQLAAPVDEEGNLRHIKYFTGEQQISRDAADAQMMAYMIQYFAGDSQILRANGLSEKETGKMLREYDRIRQEYTQITRYMDKAESGIGAEELIRQAKPVLGDVDARYFTMDTALEDANDVMDAWDKAEAAVENYGSIAGVNASVARLAGMAEINLRNAINLGKIDAVQGRMAIEQMRQVQQEATQLLQDYVDFVRGPATAEAGQAEGSSPEESAAVENPSAEVNQAVEQTDGSAPNELATVENPAAEVNQAVEQNAPAVQVEQTAENNKTPAQAEVPVQTETIGQQGTQVEPVGQAATEGENRNGEPEGIEVQQGRDPGVGADGQIGAVGESAEDAGRGQRSDAAEIIRAAAAEGVEKRSPQSYQIKGGSKSKTMTIIPADAVERIETLRNVRDAIAADGGEVVFFTGKLEVWNQYTKRFDAVEGLRQETADGKVTYYVKADRVSKSAEMIYLHEDFHDIVARNRGLLLDMVDQLTERLGADGVESLVQKYITAYRGIYGVINDNMTSDEIADLEMIYLEEILADAYGGIRRGNVNISEAVSVVEDSRGAIDRAKQNRRAMESRNGPNGQRYSVEDDEYMAAVKSGDMETAQRMVDEAARAAGYTLKRFHETAPENVFHVFDLSRNTNASGDGQTPFGIFTKSHNRSVGLGGKQMQLFVKAKNTFWSFNRDMLDQTLPAEYRQLREDLKNIDEEYSEKSEAAEWRVIDAIDAWFDEQPDGDELRMQWDILKPFSEQKFGDRVPQWIIDEEKASKAISDEWENKTNRAISKQKQWLTKWLRDSGYDSMELSIDNGAGDRETDALIVLDENQVKSADPVTYDDNGEVIPLSKRFDSETGDIRYSVEDEAQELNEAYRRSMARESDPEQRAAEIKTERAKEASTDQLQNMYKASMQRLSHFKWAQRNGVLTDEMAARMAKVEETLKIQGAELETRRKKAKERRERERLEEAENQRPIEAKKNLKRELRSIYSIPSGEISTANDLIERAANKIIQHGKITNQDKNELLDMLYSKGLVKVGPDDYYGEIRSYVAGGRIYVPEALREEFGDDWNNFRKRAFGSKLYLTDDSSDMSTDTWIMDLAQMYPGGFSEDMDLREGLEQIVTLAEEGRAENLTLAEMMRRNKDEYGWSIEEQMEDMEVRAEQALRDFGKAAKLEVDLRRESAYKQIQQRNKYREMMEREARNRKESQKRNEVMHQIQQLSKMRNRTAPEIKDQIDQILHGIDTVARSISEAGLENLQLLAEKYNMAKDDPNFIPNPYVENRLMRLQQTQLNDMEIEDVVVLGRTINALVHSIQTANKLLGEQRSEEISEAAKMAIEELKGSKGTDGGKMFKWAVENHLSPVRFMKMLGGWRTDGMFTNLALDLERGQTRQLRYQEQATRLFDRILEDPRIKAWLPTAAGKDAKWITVDVPTGVGKTEKGAKIELTKLHITPMMRVSLYLHSLNGDNLRHIEGGGVTVPDMELYKKGRLKDAYAKGTRVKMMPETVRAIVKGMTAEEKQFAKVLDTYYNRFSKDRINEVSMLLDGFERAGGDHYYHINTDKNFLAAQPESVQKNISLESIGSIVNERVHAQTPILLEDASTALTDHIDQISKYYGMTIPIRDFNAIMNYTVHSQGVGNAYSTSTKEVLGQKWGSGAQQYLNKLLADLQGSTSINDMASNMLATLRGKLAGASLSFNPAVALSQVASYPGAMQVLGSKALIQGLKVWEKVDKNLIAKYSPLYWYRNQGNFTEELGDYMKAKTLEQKLPILLNWIQEMDSLTVRRLWAASEYYVRSNTDLQPGTQAEIDAGTDEFYTKVAEIFNRAVYDTQPNYTTMQKAQISRTESDLVKALTMFKTVPLQYYNMAFEAVETYRAAKARGNKTETTTARKYLQRTVAGLLTANMLYVGIKAAFKALRGKGDRYKHEDGSWDVLSIMEGLGLDLAETFAGSLIGGAEALDFAEKLIGTIADGKYSRFNAGEISALGLVEDVAGSILNLGAAINKGDGGAAAAALLDEAKNIATAYGIPVRNAESYLAAAVKGAWPTGYAVYNNLFDEVERSDLSKESGNDLDAAISVLMANRTDDLTDDVVEELARLWKDGRKNALPSGIPASVKIDGEDKVLKAKEKTQYRDQWSQIVSGALPMLMATEEYLGSDDLTRSKLLNRLYDYADQKAKTGLGVAADKWVQEIKGEVTEGILYTQLRRGLDRKAEHEQITMAISNIISHDAGGVSDDNAEELARLYAAGYSSLLPQETPDKISYTVDGVTVDVDLTDQQRDKYRQTYQDVVGTALDRLMMSSSYAEADDKGRAALVQKMWRFAAETAKNDVVPEYEVDRWIADGYTAMEDGIPLDEYITYRADKSKITGQEDGENVDGLANKRTIELINGQPWTDEQKQAAYRATLSDTKKFDDLDKAGLSWSQLSKIMSVQGSDKDRLKIIGKLGLPEAKTQAAAMVYATDAQKRMITTGSKLGVKTADYIEVLSNADSNGSGSISSDEAKTYIMSMGLSPQQSAYLWQMATGSKSAKNNPFSKTFGWDFVDRLPD